MASTGAPAPKPSPPSFLTNVGVGAIAGIVEVTVDQPLIYFKNCVQTVRLRLANSLPFVRWFHAGPSPSRTLCFYSSVTHLQGQKIHFAPSVLYRGYGINAASLGPITAVQVGFSSLIYDTGRGGEGRGWEVAASAFLLPFCCF